MQNGGKPSSRDAIPQYSSMEEYMSLSPYERGGSGAVENTFGPEDYILGAFPLARALSPAARAIGKYLGLGKKAAPAASQSQRAIKELVEESRAGVTSRADVAKPSATRDLVTREGRMPEGSRMTGKFGTEIDDMVLRDARSLQRYLDDLQNQTINFPSDATSAADAMSRMNILETPGIAGVETPKQLFEFLMKPSAGAQQDAVRLLRERGFPVDEVLRLQDARRYGRGAEKEFAEQLFGDLERKLDRRNMMDVFRSRVQPSKESIYRPNMNENGGRIGKKIKVLKKEGRPHDQAVAIALSMRDRGEL